MWLRSQLTTGQKSTHSSAVVTPNREEAVLIGCIGECHSPQNASPNRLISALAMDWSWSAIIVDKTRYCNGPGGARRGSCCSCRDAPFQPGWPADPPWNTYMRRQAGTHQQPFNILHIEITSDSHRNFRTAAERLDRDRRPVERGRGWREALCSPAIGTERGGRRALASPLASISSPAACLRAGNQRPMPAASGCAC